MASILGTSFVFITGASATLPSAYDAKLKLATKVGFGQAIPLAVPSCKIVKVKSTYSEKCTYEKFIITINSFKFNDNFYTRGRNYKKEFSAKDFDIFTDGSYKEVLQQVEESV